MGAEPQEPAHAELSAAAGIHTATDICTANIKMHRIRLIARFPRLINAFASLENENNFLLKYNESVCFLLHIDIVILTLLHQYVNMNKINSCNIHN